MTEPDLVNRLAGIAPGSAHARLRLERADIARHTQGAYEALIEPDEPGKLTLTERSAIARDVAMLNQDSGLAAHYGALLGARGGEPAGARWTAIAAHVEMATSRPREASRAAIENLRAATLGEAEIVTLSQIVAFVSYQSRVLSGLRLMDHSPPHAEVLGEAEPRSTRDRGASFEAELRSAPQDEGVGAGKSPTLRMPFTTEALEWAPWIEPVELASASPEQRASLSETPSNIRVSAYSLVLAHDPAALSERSPLFNKIMYGPRGLPRAERELATLVESVLNGCVYCASVHARRFIDLAKEPAVVDAIYAGTVPPLDLRRGAIVAYAAVLSETPSRATQAHVAGLRDAGLSELEILDLTHAVAMFAWANRLMQTLGEPAREA